MFVIACRRNLHKNAIGMLLKFTFLLAFAIFSAKIQILVYISDPLEITVDQLLILASCCLSGDCRIVRTLGKPIPTFGARALTKD